MYAEVSEMDTPSDTTTTRETLALRVVAGKQILTISNGSGDASFAMSSSADGELTGGVPDGEPAGGVPDGALVCYNMAAAVLSSYARDPSAPVALKVAFLGHVIPVEVSFRQEARPNGVEALYGDGQSSGVISDGSSSVPGGLIVSAAVAREQGELREAYFSETSLAGSPPQPLARTTCRLVQMVPVAPPVGT
jgi:hypothetical protein